jgi:hypothetical protein
VKYPNLRTNRLKAEDEEMAVAPLTIHLSRVPFLWNTKVAAVREETSQCGVSIICLEELLTP